MLLLDRYLGFHFFTNEGGGNSMMFMNLIWAWGHPEVYILVLPAFGVFSEVISTFSGKPLFGYRSMVMATMGIFVLAFMVWLHHFFTMGAGADVNGFFGITTMIIAVPTGVKIFNWLFTMYGGTIRFSSAMLWSLGFMVTFIIGGMTGVLLAVPPADFVLHNSLFPGGALPQRHHRRRAVRRLRRLHLLVPEGVRLPTARGARQGGVRLLVRRLLRRLHAAVRARPDGHDAAQCKHYDVAEWRPWLLVAAAGAALILCGILCQVAQLVLSIRRREALRDRTGDPWDGRSLEWITASPPPRIQFRRAARCSRR